MLGLELFLTVLLPFQNPLSSSSFFNHFFHFFFQALIEWGFSALYKNEKREKSGRKRRMVLLCWDKEQWQQLYMHKALNPVFMQVSVLQVWYIYTSIRSFCDNFSCMQMSSSFWFVFWTIFLSKPWI